MTDPIEALRARLGGDKLTTSPTVLHSHGRDENYPEVRPPLAVAYAEQVEDVQTVLGWCREQRISLIPFGAGTSLEGALVPAGQDASAHGAGVVVELHLHECRAHPRDLAGALLRALKKPRRTERQPAEQAKPYGRERCRDSDLAAHRKECRKYQQHDPTRQLEHGGKLARVGL